MMEGRVCDGWMVANHQKKMVRLILFFVFFRKGWWLSSIKARKKEIGAESENKGEGGLFS